MVDILVEMGGQPPPPGGGEGGGERGKTRPGHPLTTGGGEGGGRGGGNSSYAIRAQTQTHQKSSHPKMKRYNIVVTMVKEEGVVVTFNNEFLENVNTTVGVKNGLETQGNQAYF